MQFLPWIKQYLFPLEKERLANCTVVITVNKKRFKNEKCGRLLAVLRVHFQAQVSDAHQRADSVKFSDPSGTKKIKDWRECENVAHGGVLGKKRKLIYVTFVFGDSLRAEWYLK